MKRGRSDSDDNQKNRRRRRDTSGSGRGSSAVPPDGSGGGGRRILTGDESAEEFIGQLHSSRVLELADIANETDIQDEIIARISRREDEDRFLSDIDARRRVAAQRRKRELEEIRDDALAADAAGFGGTSEGASQNTGGSAMPRPDELVAADGMVGIQAPPPPPPPPANPEVPNAAAVLLGIQGLNPQPVAAVLAALNPQNGAAAEEDDEQENTTDWV